MDEYLPRILVALAGLIAIGCYCYRCGYAAGHADGELGIQRPPPAPQAGGGPGVPE